MLLAAAMIDIRVWMSLAYPAYGFALLLLVAVDVVGHVGPGRAALDRASARWNCSRRS